MAKKPDSHEGTKAQSQSNEPTEAELEYDKLNKLFKAETDPVKRTELYEQCQKTLAAKTKR